MTSSDLSGEFPDEVPVADAVEQTRAAAEPDRLQSVDPDGRVAIDDADSVPMDSNESDWQEQREAVDDFDEDEFR